MDEENGLAETSRSDKEEKNSLACQGGRWKVEKGQRVGETTCRGTPPSGIET